MQRAGLRAKTRRGFRSCSRAGGAAGVAENLLQQDFTPAAPNRCWAGDITYIRTTTGWRYLAVWMDLFSRRVVGWSLGASMEASLVLEALNRALGQRQVEPEQLLIHTDPGSTGPPPTANCWEPTESLAACLPRGAAGITPWWRACSPPSNMNSV
jgi:transposase InsO family protein